MWTFRTTGVWVCDAFILVVVAGAGWVDVSDEDSVCPSDRRLVAPTRPDLLYHKAVKKFRKQHEERIRMNIERLKAARKIGSEADWCFAQAAAELGIMRAWDAADLLVKFIDYRPKEFVPDCVDSAGFANPLTFYPAADALREIGPIARDVIIARIASAAPETSQEQIRICCWTLLFGQATFNRHFGFDYYVGAYTKKAVLRWIENYKTRVKNPRSLDRLDIAANVVRGYCGTYGRPFCELFWFPPVFELPHCVVGAPYRFAFDITLPRVKPYESLKKWAAKTRLLEDPTELEYGFGFPSVLPKGLTLSDNGIITGTPRRAGRFRFVVEVGQKTDTPYIDYWTQQQFLLVVHDGGPCEKCREN